MVMVHPLPIVPSIKSFSLSYELVAIHETLFKYNSVKILLKFSEDTATVEEEARLASTPPSPISIL